MEHSYEEIWKVALEILSDQKRMDGINQYLSFKDAVLRVLAERDGQNVPFRSIDGENFREIFWDLFRQNVITLGLNESNAEYPFFKISSFGKKFLDNPDTYFFHDVSTYESIILENIPNIDKLTLIYLKEAMQAFRSSCILSSSVMLGVATEHTFLMLLDVIENNNKYKHIYKNVFKERTILQKFNKFRNILEQNTKDIPDNIKEDLDTNMAGILSIIRNFRNDSGHPTGRIISREQCYILLNLFVPYCKKIYEMIGHFKIV